MNGLLQPRLVIVGGGGHAKVVIEAVLACGGWTIAGLVDPAAGAVAVLGVVVLGGDEALPALRSAGVTGALVALGANARREQVGLELRRLGFSLPSIVHPSAWIAPSARLGCGVVVLARACVGTDAEIADFAILNTNCSVDHDARIGQAVHIAPGCALAGNVCIGSRTLIGVGSAVRPGVRIGCDVVVGAGSAVVSDLADGLRVGGVPARALPLGETS